MLREKIARAWSRSCADRGVQQGLHGRSVQPSAPGCDVSPEYALSDQTTSRILAGDGVLALACPANCLHCWRSARIVANDFVFTPRPDQRERSAPERAHR